MKYSGNFEGGEGGLNHNTPSVCRLSEGRISIIFGTAWCVKLKLVGLVVGDVEPTKDNICILLLLHAAVNIIITTGTKSKANTINSTPTTITIGTTATKAKSIKAKNLRNI